MTTPAIENAIGSRSKRRSFALKLTPDERRHFRVALRKIGRAAGSMTHLANTIGVPVGSLFQAAKPGRRPSGILVIRVAQAGKVSVEAILSGNMNSATGTCAACGSRIGAPAGAIGGAR